MNIQIDRTLPVEVGAQLQGQIEYGLAYGDIPPGGKLPSVRDLAIQLGISPVTVSQVYKALQEKNLIVTKAGHGTFVREDLQNSNGPGKKLYSIHRLIDQLAFSAALQGIRPEELTAMVNVRLRSYKQNGRSIRLIFVGIFAEVTRSYAIDIRHHLRPMDTVEAITFNELKTSRVREKLRDVDLILTFPHRTSELRKLLGQEARIVAVNFIPSERTRILLAELDPRLRLGIISTYPEFLATFKAGIRRFAPHVDIVDSAILGSEQVSNLIASSDVIVYATGSEVVTQFLPGHLKAFEYRHMPDPRSVERSVLPLIEELRNNMLRSVG